MQELTKEQFIQEMKVFEGLCNKSQTDLKSYIDGCAELNLKEKLENRYSDFEKFIEYVTTNTNFINAPASTKYHLCIEHGLLVHSNLVVKTMIKLNNALNCNIPLYQIITCGLFHDLGKHNCYIKNEPTENQKKYGYKASVPYSFSEIEYNEHECRSVWMISKYIDLEESEFVAIMYHNSPWDGVTKNAFKKNKLMTILEMADYYSTCYLEDRLD